MEGQTAHDRTAKLAEVGVPLEHIESTGDDHIHIVLSPSEADRFCTVFAVLEETSAVKSMLQAVWT